MELMSGKITVSLSPETVAFMRALAHEIKTQDNRITATPYFLVIRSQRWRVAHEEFTRGDTKTVRVDYSGDPTEYESFEDFKQADLDNGRETSESDLQKLWEDLPEYTLEEYYEEDNAFLTEKAYQDHLRLNKHNLRGEHHSYLKHAFRNPEMSALFKAIAEFGGET